MTKKYFTTKIITSLFSLIDEKHLRALSPQQRHVFVNRREGKTIRQIAYDLGTSPQRVQTIQKNLLVALGLPSDFL